MQTLATTLIILLTCLFAPCTSATQAERLCDICKEVSLQIASICCPNKNCQGLICKECLPNLVRTALSQTSLRNNIPLTCQHDDKCHAELIPEDIMPLLADDTPFAKRLSQAYLQYSLRQSLSADEEAVYCSYPDCPGLGVVKSAQTPYLNYFICPINIDHKSCYACKNAFAGEFADHRCEALSAQKRSHTFGPVRSSNTHFTFAARVIKLSRPLLTPLSASVGFMHQFISKHAARAKQRRAEKLQQKHEIKLTRQRLQNEEIATRQYLDDIMRHHTTKACPRCKAKIEKNDGCAHMTCRCGHQFFWCCLRSYANPMEAKLHRQLCNN